MQVHNSLRDLPKFTNGVLTIGTFDGVHFGHQQILKRINNKAKSIDGESILMTFDPHPKMVLLGENHGIKLLTTVEEKIKLLERYGVDHLIIVPFSKDFASMEAEAYVKEIIVDNIRPKHIIIGYDHRYGKGRKGGLQLMVDLQEKYNYVVEEIPKQMIDDLSVSSTKVRSALTLGDVAGANQLLDHPYFLTGKVIHGEKLGRQLGFPTANLAINSPHKLIPENGIYVVEVIVKESKYNGLVSIGYRSTFSDERILNVEVYILDFNESIYGQILQVNFIDFIRQQEKFDSKEALIERMNLDVKLARDVIKRIHADDKD